jgi:hypothetical protein
MVATGTAIVYGAAGAESPNSLKVESLELVAEDLKPYEEIKVYISGRSNALVLDGNFPDTILDGNFPDTLLDSNFPDTVLDGNFPDIHTHDNNSTLNSDSNMLPSPKVLI